MKPSLDAAEGCSVSPRKGRGPDNCEHADVVVQRAANCRCNNVPLRIEVGGQRATALDKALRGHNPSICIGQGVLKQWLSKYQSGAKPASEAISSASRAELQQKYGEELQRMADEHPTPYRLRQALEKRSPPVLATAGVLKEWFKHHRSELKYIAKAGDLEVHCGGRIREAGARGYDAEGLCRWLREQVKTPSFTPGIC